MILIYCKEEEKSIKKHLSKLHWDLLTRTCVEEEESVFLGSAQVTVGELPSILKSELDIFCLA